MDRTIRKIVIAPDSFKGCLTAQEVAEAISDGVSRVLPGCERVLLPVADGGEGFSDAILAARGGTWRELEAADPLGRTIPVRYGLSEGSAFIDTAAACGLTLLRPEERHPLLTSTRGLGEMICDALRQGCRDIVVGLGGSATHDAGTGMLHALGFRFLDADGEELPPCGASLEKIAAIERSRVLPELVETHFTAACDVSTSFCGPGGAAEVFAPQKGATPEEVRRLDRGTAVFADLILKETGIDLRTVPGAGAAGGLGGAFAALLKARLIPGIELVLDAGGFDQALEGADLVITGEGRLDAQTVSGKAIAGILRHATRAQVPVLALAGRILPGPELAALPFRRCCAVTPENVPDRIAMQPEYARVRIADAVGNCLQDL